MATMEELAATWVDRYLFPDDAVPGMASVDLHGLIARHRRAANDACDGPGSRDPLQIDIAQDMVDQCLDALLARGEELSEDERAAAPWRDWRTDEQKAADAVAEEERDRAWRAVYLPWRDSIEAMFADAVAGRELPPAAAGILCRRSGNNGSCRKYLSGAEVLRVERYLRDALGVALDGSEERVLAHDYSQHKNVPFAEHPGPHFYWSFPLTADRRLWLLLARLSADGVFGDVVAELIDVYDYGPSPYDPRHINCDMPRSLIEEARRLPLPELGGRPLYA
jgi:hypothetical protein